MKSVIHFINVINNVDSKILREIKLLLNCALLRPTHFLEEDWSRKLPADCSLANFLFGVLVCPCSHYYVLVTKNGTTPHCITPNSLV